MWMRCFAAVSRSVKRREALFDAAAPCACALPRHGRRHDRESCAQISHKKLLPEPIGLSPNREVCGDPTRRCRVYLDAPPTPRLRCAGSRSLDVRSRLGAGT